MTILREFLTPLDAKYETPVRKRGGYILSKQLNNHQDCVTKPQIIQAAYAVVHHRQKRVKSLWCFIAGLFLLVLEVGLLFSLIPLDSISLNLIRNDGLLVLLSIVILVTLVMTGWCFAVHADDTEEIEARFYLYGLLDSACKDRQLADDAPFPDSDKTLTFKRIAQHIRDMRAIEKNYMVQFLKECKDDWLRQGKQ